MINDRKERNEKWERDRNKVNENKESTLNQIMNKKVSDSVSDMTNNNNGNTVEEVVLENKIANNDYNDESVVVIENGTDTGKCGENINNEVTENKVSNVVKISDDYNGDKMMNNDEVVDNKVSNGVNYNNQYNNELTSNSGKIVEKGVSKGDTEKINSDDENIELVGSSERVMISIDVLEREYEESYFVEVGQRVNFPRVKCEIMVSHVFREDESSSVEDKRSSKCPLIFCASGRARWRLNSVVVPSAWSERENGKWEWEVDFVKKREVVLFDINRDYKELVGMLDRELMILSSYLVMRIVQQ